MKTAVSIYRGETFLVSADQCDYTSAKQLGLVCPFCKSAVFLRCGHQRTHKGGSLIISPTFAHYKTGSFEDFDCEERSHTKQGLAEIQRIRTEFRGQRLELYNRHLWSMIKSDRNITRDRLKRVQKVVGQEWLDFANNEIRRYMVSHMEVLYEQINDHEHRVNAISAQDLMSSSRDDEEYRRTIQGELEVQRNYFATHNKGIHQAISAEVLEFLSTRSGGYARQNCLKSIMSIGVERLDSRLLKGLDFSELAKSMAMFVAGTHWEDVIKKFSPEVETLKSGEEE